MVASSEIDKGRPSDLQKRFDTLARLEETELSGGHVDVLMEEVDPTHNKAITHELEGLNPDHVETKNLTGFERFGVLVKRNRREITRLLRHR